jgi:hypothetical protein
MATMTNSRQVAEDRHEGKRDLATLGLTPVDATVYVTLVGHPRSTATEISEHCGMPVNRVGRVLSRLVADGFASRLPGRRGSYVAVAPDVVLGGLLSQRESELGRARAAAHELMELHREASRFSDPAAAVEVVTGRENIGRRVDYMHTTVRHQIRGFDRPPYVREPGHDGVMEHRRLRDGVAYRVIYDQQALSWPGRMESDVLLSRAFGEQGRVRPELSMKMLLADDQIALIPLGSSEHLVDVAYVIHPCALLDALSQLFEAEWDRAVPLSLVAARRDQPDAWRHAPAEAEPDPATVTLLALLASGQTDAGIARSLGWSLRTTQRRVHELLVSLNASTRFQAGIAARDRGWV